MKALIMNTNIENEVSKIVFKRKYMSIVELSEVLNVSQSTIRRVLNRLQSKKLVERSHGGVRAVLTDNVAPNFVLRKHTNATQKKMIALKALKLIKEGDVIFLDGSTSTYFMAEYLNEFDNVTVITNGIDTLVALAGCGVNAISTGGCVSGANKSALVGNFAINTVESIHANIAFFSCGAIAKDGKMTDCYIDEVAARKKMIENSDISVLLCDSDKFGKTQPYVIGNVNEIDYIVTDSFNDGVIESKPKKGIIY